MRIRTQNLIAIVPLFLGMAVVAGGMTYSTVRGELLWGLREEASSLGVSIGEFVGGAGLVAGADADDLRARAAELELPITRVLAHGQTKQIMLFDASGALAWSIMAAEPEAGSGTAALPPHPGALADSVAMALSEGNDIALTPVIEVPGGGSMMLAYAPLEDAAGNRAGVLGVAIDASSLGELSRNVLIGLVRLTLLAILIGTAAALFISSLLTRNVKALSRAALEVAGGAYDRQIQIGTIQELSDLSNTFNTMSSVLQDLVERTRRTLIEGEQFRTPLDLARTYRLERWPELQRSYPGVQVASKSVGEGHPGDVFGIIEQEDRLIVYLGRITEGRELDSAISAAAARRAIEEGARRWPIDQVIDRVSRLMRTQFQSLSWERAGGSTGSLSIFDGSGAPAIQQVALDGESAILLHTFGPETGTLLRRWEEVFRGEAPEPLVELLTRTVLSGTLGTLVAIGRGPTDGEQEPVLSNAVSDSSIWEIEE